MANVAVTIRLQSDDLVPVRIQGAVVVVYPAGSSTVVTQGTTNSSGEFSPVLPEASYDLRFYKLGISVRPSQPQRIVVDAALSNTFTVTAHVHTLPEYVDPKLCRITGSLFGSGGSTFSGVRLGFMPKPDILVPSSGQVLLPQHELSVKDDGGGYYDFGLYRGVKYRGVIAGLDLLLGNEAILDIQVPNVPALALDSLLFPLPTSASFSSLSLSLPLGSGPNEEITRSIGFNDGSIRDKSVPWATISIVVDDPSIVLVTGSSTNGTLTITPLKGGSTSVTCTRQISTQAFWLNEPAFSSEELVVTVT